MALGRGRCIFKIWSCMEGFRFCFLALRGQPIRPLVTVAWCEAREQNATLLIIPTLVCAEVGLVHLHKRCSTSQTKLA
jgi:hypothetical protein